MIVEKGHFHVAEKYCGGQGPLGPPVPTALITGKIFPGTVFKTEAVVQRCSVEKVFLEISQNSQVNTCARISFSIKLRA